MAYGTGERIALLVVRDFHSVFRDNWTFGTIGEFIVCDLDNRRECA